MLSFHAFWNLFHVSLLLHCVHAFLERDIVRDGLTSSLTGFPGTAFQTVRYEPLCGTLGDSSLRSSAFSIGHCGPVVMNAYSNNSDTFAIYDESGVRLVGAVVGGGLDLCMCFSLSTAGGSAADLCWFISGDGEVDIWWQLQLDHLIAGSYRPGSAKSLHQCSAIDLSAAKASWSATAVTHTVSETTKTLGAHTNTVVQIKTSTFTPSVVAVTTARVTTITGADGQLTTSTITYTTELPVVTVNKGLSQSDQIALGVGLGLGIPSFLVALVSLMFMKRPRRTRHDLIQRF